MQRTITKTGHVVERQVRAHLILVPMNTGPARLEALYTLNETAAFIWAGITPGIVENDLVGRLVESYDIDETSARKDVSRILDRLAAIGAVTVAWKE